MELGEIESALRQLEDVEEAVVVVAHSTTLVAFTAGTASKAEMRAKCQSMLHPPMMVPSVFRRSTKP